MEFLFLLRQSRRAGHKDKTKRERSTRTFALVRGLTSYPTRIENGILWVLVLSDGLSCSRRSVREDLLLCETHEGSGQVHSEGEVTSSCLNMISLEGVPVVTEENFLASL